MRINMTGRETGGKPVKAGPPRAAAGRHEGAERADSAEYIAVLCSQLQRIAAANGHKFLAYLIEMAVIEAWCLCAPDEIAGREKSRPGGKEPAAD